MAVKSGSIACAMLIAASSGSGCSVVLDWDQRIDAGPDPAACGFKEPNDTIDAAMPLAITETGPAAICVPNDRDFYRFTVPAELQNVRISADFSLAMSQDIDMRLYDPANANAVLSEGLSFVTPETVLCPGNMPTCPQLVAGDYILEVFGASPTVFNTYTLAITITPQ